MTQSSRFSPPRGPGWHAGRVALALGLLGALVRCSDPINLPVTEGCQATSQCALGLVCDQDARQCIPTPDNGVIGSFRCAGVDDKGKGYPKKGIGSSQILGLLDGLDDLALVAKSTCILTEQEVILLAVDANEGLQLDADGYRLYVRVARSAIQPGVSVPITGAFLERYVDADKSYRDYARTPAEVPGVAPEIGRIRFAAIPQPGTLTEGYLNVTQLQSCAAEELSDDDQGNGVASGECFPIAEDIPDVDYPPEASNPDLIDPDNGEGGAAGDDGEGGAAGDDGEGGAAGDSSEGGAAGDSSEGGAAGDGGEAGDSSEGGAAGDGGEAGSGEAGDSGVAGDSGSEGGAAGDSGQGGDAGDAGDGGAGGE